jgi:hypothetical protein
MTDITKSFNSVDLNKLLGGYKCLNRMGGSGIIPVIIDGNMFNIHNSASKIDLDFFKSSTENIYNTSTVGKKLSFLFMIYLSAGDYEFNAMPGNTSFISFLSSKLENSTYYIPSGIYTVQVFVDSGYKFQVNIKKSNESIMKSITSYILKCENVETDDIIYENFYEQILEDCVLVGNKTSSLCSRILNSNIPSDPRYKQINYISDNNIISEDWKEVENTCPSTCGSGFKKNMKIMRRNLDYGIVKKTSEINIVDCSKPCPVDGIFTPWSNWGSCTKSCGGGTQNRTRTYTPAINGGVDLADKANINESRACNTQLCPAPKVPSTKIIDTNLHTYTMLDIKSPSGKYRFVWQPKSYLINVYNLSDGFWSSVTSIYIKNNANNAALGTYNNNFAAYNSSITTSSIMGTSPSDFQRIVITDNGDVVFENVFGDPVGIAIANGTKLNFL